jgi:hypothetical protein
VYLLLRLDFEKILLMFNCINEFKIGEFIMIMKNLTSVEMSVVSGGACTGVPSQMCTSATSKTGPTAGGVCSSTKYGVITTSGGSTVNYYCYSTTVGTPTAMVTDKTYCDPVDVHYFENAAGGTSYAGSSAYPSTGADAVGSYAPC